MSFQLLTAWTRRLAQVHLTTTTSSSWKTAAAIPTLQIRSLAQKKAGKSSNKKEKKQSLQKVEYNEQHKLENTDFPKEDDTLLDAPPIVIPQDDAYRERQLKQQALNLGRAFVKSIMENEYEPIPDSDGMRVLRNVIDVESGEPLDVIIRSITIPFWQKCIEKVNAPEMQYRVAAIGTPGIGKSTSTSILIQMLLKEGKTVVYLVRSKLTVKWYYEFIPGPNNSIVTNVYPEKTNPFAIPSHWMNSTYHIIDPGNTKDDCNPPIDFKPKVILVPSPDSGHWGGTEFDKARNRKVGTFLYLPLWSLADLLSARPIFCQTMTEEEVKMNYRFFGGVPRHVFAVESEREKKLKIQNFALAVLTFEQVESIVRGGMDSNDSFSPGTAKSALMGYILADDDKGDFEKGKAILLSAIIEEKVYTKFMAKLWAIMLSLGEDGWKMFEAYTRFLMTNKNRRQLSFECRRCVGKSDRGDNTTEFIMLGGCSEVRLGLNPFMEAKTESNARVLFHSVKRNNKLFDFMYKDEDDHFHAFQVTVGNTHSANTTHIEELQELVGGASKLSIYYLVPDKNFAGFATKPVNPSDDKNSNVSCDIWHVLIPCPEAESKLVPSASDDPTDSISEPPEPPYAT